MNTHQSKSEKKPAELSQPQQQLAKPAQSHTLAVETLSDEQVAKHTPMMQHYISVKKSHPEHLLFYRMGDFFEMFWADAVKVAELLNLTLTYRGESSGVKIPMAGVPFHAADNYLRRLLAEGQTIVICDQIGPVPKKGLVKREVTRILTPGTLFESEYLSDQSDSITACIDFDGNNWGVAWIDFSCGTLWCCECTSLSQALEQLNRRLPAEWLCGESRFTQLQSALEQMGERTGLSELAPKQVPSWYFDAQEGRQRLEKILGTDNLTGWNCDHISVASGCINALLGYCSETSKHSLQHIHSLRYEHCSDLLTLDPVASQSLAIEVGDHGQPSLLSCIDYCRTAMGRRTLREWLRALSNRPLNAHLRLDSVQQLIQSSQLRRLADGLANVKDIDRILTRVSTGTASPKDLMDLALSLQAIEDEKQGILEACGLTDRPALLGECCEQITDYSSLTTCLLGAIKQPAPTRTALGGFILPGYNTALDELRNLASGANDAMQSLQDKAQSQLGLSKLKVGYNRVTGYYFEISKANQPSQIPEEYRPIQTLKSAVRYRHQELSDLEQRVLQAQMQINQLEQSIFNELLTLVQAQIPSMRKTAQAIATIDVLINFAIISSSRSYTRPQVHDGIGLEIQGARHPVVELKLSERAASSKTATADHFIPNPIHLDASASTQIITGPNMGGKSTYMRSAALLVVMSYLGCFIPAQSARIGSFTNIFTRIGSGDRLSEGLSTFMVEMTETSKILRSASPKSLVILDEVGRGTSTWDGVAIAWAVCEYISKENQAMCLFATHYTELTQLAELYPHITNRCFTATKTKDAIKFDYQIKTGIADKSYGLEVASLAGFPSIALAFAQNHLKRSLDSHQVDQLNMFSTTDNPASSSISQVEQPAMSAEELATLKANADQGNDIVNYLDQLEPNSMTPMQALQIMAELKAKWSKS